MASIVTGAGEIRSWVTLEAALFRVCVAAEYVMAVDRDVVLARTQNSDEPVLDLSARWGNTSREQAPYVVWLQGQPGIFGLAVDEVRQFNSDAPTRPVPQLGLRQSGLLEGCLEHGGSVYLILSLQALAGLTAEAG
ncbi:MAG: chemotaxis protein CheW [Myxococcota bacterium]